ncbi:MAG: VOC family protein [Anaerolineae bacterium]|nr:VOC family protein [Anaerolineae bacterium]
MELKAHHFAISVDDLEATLQWYQQKLGFTITHRMDFPDWRGRGAFARLGAIQIEIFQFDVHAPMPPERFTVEGDLRVVGLKHFAFEVEDLDAAIAELTGRGVEFATPIGHVPNTNGDRYAMFKDNNGILIELYQSGRS